MDFTFTPEQDEAAELAAEIQRDIIGYVGLGLPAARR